MELISHSNAYATKELIVPSRTVESMGTVKHLDVPFAFGLCNFGLYISKLGGRAIVSVWSLFVIIVGPL